MIPPKEKGGEEVLRNLFDGITNRYTD